MNFKQIGFGLAASAALTTSFVLIGTPAEAIDIKNGNKLSLYGDVKISGDNNNYTFDFLNTFITPSSTNPFKIYDEVVVKDLTAPNGTPNDTTAPLTPFISDIDLIDGTKANFNLEKLNFATYTLEDKRSFFLTMSGLFQNGEEILGSGSFTSQISANVDPLTGAIEQTSFSGQIVAVPTPALLPGLIGMAATALRKKRKGEIA